MFVGLNKVGNPPVRLIFLKSSSNSMLVSWMKASCILPVIINMYDLHTVNSDSVLHMWFSNLSVFVWLEKAKAVYYVILAMQFIFSYWGRNTMEWEGKKSLVTAEWNAWMRRAFSELCSLTPSLTNALQMAVEAHWCATQCKGEKLYGW